MLATIDQLKDALGISQTEVNVARDAQLNSSLVTANALIAGYIGFDVSDTSTEHVFTATLDGATRHIKLPYFPVIDVMGVTNGGNVVDFAHWYVNNRLGMVELPYPHGLSSGYDRFGYRVTLVYTAGFEDIPADLNTVCLNMAAAIYNLGGSFATSGTSGGTGELKSLTMFDAMSMSFDTGGSQSAAAEDAPGTPAAMVKMWSFMLNKYRVNYPAMA